MKKTAIILMLIIATLLPATVRAADYSGLSRAWQAERDAAGVQLVKLWLARAPKPVLDRVVLRFVDREIKLSVIDPDARLLFSDPECKNQEIPVFLLIIVLRENGIDLDPAIFFAGKHFCLPPKRGRERDGKNQP